LGTTWGTGCCWLRPSDFKAFFVPSDTVARFGGDEFVVLCEDVATERQAREIASRIAVAVAAPIDLGPGEAVLTASLGIALSKSSTASPEGLLRDADAAMYKA
jgi:diguanylate cyclase (GGDEF)-like protein